MASTTIDEVKPGSLVAIRGQKWVVTEVDPVEASTLVRCRASRTAATAHLGSDLGGRTGPAGLTQWLAARRHRPGLRPAGAARFLPLPGWA